MQDSSDAPAFVKRTKVKNVRSRPISPANDAALTNVEPGASPSTLATKLKNKLKARAKPKSRLSFGADEEEGEEDVFQVKKSNLSRRLALGSHPASPALALPSSLDQASISPQGSGPVYSKEYLSELKAGTPSTPSNRAPISTYDADVSFGASDIGDTTLESMDLTSGGDTSIPSESSILAAKQKRERLRSSKVDNEEGDFISLSVTKMEDTSRGPHPESRLMREDDEVGEGDDEYAEYTSAQERIALGKKAKKKEAAQRRGAMQDMIADAEEEDEETMEWEQEQLRRGGRGTIETMEPTSVKQVYKPAPIPPPTPIPVLGPAVTRVTESLTDLTTSHASSTTAMSTLSDERQNLEAKEKEMRDMVAKAEMKRSWFVAFKEWVESVATFLDEKYPLLENLEDEHVSLLKERSEMISRRRLQDDEDDLSSFFGSPSEAPMLEAEELDELGRVIPQQNSTISRRERRAARAMRRSQRPATQEDEGYSTDSELPPSDASDFATAMSKLSAKSQDVLSDVRSDEFRNPALGVGKWFGEWRSKYSETYTGAYGGLGMVSAWEFWVRLEIVGWDPMEDPQTLDSSMWYSSLYVYSRPRTSKDMDEDEEPELGPDGDLVSAMISSAVVPRLCKIIQGGAFDPYSTKHLRKLIDLAEQIEASANKDKFEMLAKSAIASFREAVSTTENAVGKYSQFSGMQFDPLSIRARRRFLVRRFKLLGNMLRWRKYTGEKFGVGDLITMTVLNCMNPVADSGWDVGGQEIMQRVVKVLPGELCPASLKSRFTQIQ